MIFLSIASISFAISTIILAVVNGGMRSEISDLKKQLGDVSSTTMIPIPDSSSVISIVTEAPPAVNKTNIIQRIST